MGIHFFDDDMALWRNEMRISEIKDEINKLTIEDQLLLIEDVWDSIARNNSELPMHEWQKKELDQRYSDYKAGKQKLYDWDSVHDELRNTYK